MINNSYIMSEKRSTVGVQPVGKKPRESYSLELKLDVIRRIESGSSGAEVGRLLRMPATTVRSIYSDAKNIRASAKRGTPVFSKLVTKKRNPLVEKMEHLLALWIEDMNDNALPMSQHLIIEKGKSLYEELKTIEPAMYAKISRDEDFKASRGWYDRFRKRHNLCNVKFTGEASGADQVAADAFVPMLWKLIEEGGYSAKQVFNFDETDLFWKRMPSRTPIFRDEKVAPGFKAAKDYLTVLLGGNAVGDCKLKPLVIYHSETPRALKHCVKSKLPVQWKSNPKAWMTSIIFTEYITDYCIPLFKEYCKKEKLEFKILLILDNAPAHRIEFEALCPNIRVVFLPFNTTSILQPMDQGVIAAFKSYYLRRSFRRLVNETSGEGKSTITEFWKKFNIMDGIKQIEESWNDVSKQCMNGVWKRLIPHFVNNLTGIEDINTVHKEIVLLANVIGFDEVDESGVQEVLVSPREFLTAEDLIYVDEQWRRDDDDDIEEENEIQTVPEKPISIAKFRQAFDFLDQALEIFRENDPYLERSCNVNRTIEDAISCYRALNHSKAQVTKQISYNSFFHTAPKSSSTSTVALEIPSTSKEILEIENFSPSTEHSADENLFSPETPTSDDPDISPSTSSSSHLF